MYTEESNMENFLTNLAAVVLGIMLTFGVNFLWRRREENRRTRDILILVRNELVTNKEFFRLQEEFMKKDGNIYKKILEAKNDLASIPADILKTYHTDIQQISVGPLMNSAWQIFQNSEIIQKMSNKAMIVTLTNCYSMIASWHEYIMKDYWENKKKMFLVELDDPYRFFDAVLKNHEVYNFFNAFSTDSQSIWDTFSSTDAIIDYAISLLDKHGNYQYDMEEEDNKMKAYFEARFSQKEDTAQP